MPHHPECEHDTTPASPVEDAAHPGHGRRLLNSLIALAVVGAIVVGLLLAVPGLAQVRSDIEHAHPQWLGLAALSEVLSCLGYVLLFELVFYRMPRRLAARIAWSELAANTVVSAGGVGGLGLGAWVMASKGMDRERIARRSIAVYLLSSAVSMTALVILGAGLATGALYGPHRFSLTILPALIGIAAVAVVAALPRWAEPVAERWRARGRRRASASLAALADGVRTALSILRRPDWRLAGAVAYWLFDVAALWLSFRALGHVPSLPVVMMGYLIGQLAGSLPVPGGIGIVEGGLFGALLIYGVHADGAAAAILVYRTLALWLPAVLGSLAFLLLRRNLDEPVALRPAETDG